MAGHAAKPHTGPLIDALAEFAIKRADEERKKAAAAPARRPSRSRPVC